MNIYFKTCKLERVFNSEKKLRREYGSRQAEAIMIRMAILKGAKHLGMVPTDKPTRRHQLKASRKDQFAVDLVPPYRLIFCPDHNPVPRRDDGGIEIELVNAIKIIEVVDYH